LQSKNIFIAGYKPIGLCLSSKMNKNSIGRIMEAVYGVIRSMEYACLQKRQYISQYLFNVLFGKLEFGIGKHPDEFIDGFLTSQRNIP